MPALICDQCRAHDASAIDWDGQTWCPACHDRVCAARTERGALAPAVFDLSIVHTLLAGPTFWHPRTRAVFAPNLEMVARWAARLGLEPPP